MKQLFDRLDPGLRASGSSHGRVVEGLGQAPDVRLGCGHSFHLDCVKTFMDQKWTPPKIQ